MMRHRGYVLMDAMLGLFLVGAAAGLLVTALVQVSNARARLSHDRENLAALEAHALVNAPLPPEAHAEPLGDGWVRLRLGHAELITRGEANR